MNRSSRTFRRYMIFFVAAMLAIAAYYAAAYRLPLRADWADTPADPSTFMSASDVSAAASYSMLRDMLFFANAFWEWGMLLWLLTSGTARGLAQGLKSRVPSVVVRFVVYIAAVVAALFALGFPLRLLSYAVAKHYDVATMTPSVWLRDQLVALGVEYGIMLAATAVVFVLVRKGGTWWFRLWLVSVPFVLFMMYFRPVAIDPLFHEFRPLQNERLAQAIVRMTSEAGIPTERVFQANYSEKTNAVNAYVDGFGPSLRIVVWDTALHRLTEPEILVLTAHEIAHYVKRHLEWSAAGAVASTFVLLWLGNKAYIFVLKRWRAFLFVRNPADWAGLPLMLLVVSVLSFASTPLSSAVSRHAEREADQYAYALTKRPDAAVTLYQKLAISARGTVDPPALTYWFRYTHPSLGERIAEAMRMGSER